MHGNATNTDEYLQSLTEWKRDNLVLFRKLIHEVKPEVTEDIKWGVPVFMVGKKMVFAMSAFKAHTKYNFIANGAKLADSDGLFNNGLESSKSRGIDLHEGQSINEAALKELIKLAIDQL